MNIILNPPILFRKDVSANTFAIRIRIQMLNLECIKKNNFFLIFKINDFFLIYLKIRMVTQYFLL